jgi:hypothetical protein
MSNKRITDLTELTTPTTDDVFPVVDIATNTTTKVQLGNLPVPSSVTTALATKQDSLVSGTNIKTINSTSVLGSGNIAVQETLVSGTNIKTINSTTLLGSGNITIAANPSGVSGAIQFSNGSAFASDAANLFWDDTNNRLGVGTNVPTQALEVRGSALIQNVSGTDGSIQIGANLGGIVLSSANRSEIQLATNARMTTRGTGITFRANSGEPNGAVLGVVGSGSTSATTSLLVQNSAGTTALQVQDNLNTTLGGGLTMPNFSAINSGSNSISFETFRTRFDASFNTVAGQYAFSFNDGGGASAATSGTLGRFNLLSRFAPTSGTAVYNTALINPTVNQTGGANGITRGLFIDPTLTAAADFRAIQTTAGKIIFGGLPTSSAGLVSGQLWNDAGTLKIA